MSIPQHELDKTMTETQKLEQIKEHFKKALKDQFDEKKFNKDVEKGITITLQDKEKYKKKDENKQVNHLQNSQQKPVATFQNKELSFKSRFKNGTYVAEGSNGHIIQSKNLDDFNQQIAKTFKDNALKNHRQAQCTFRTSYDPNSEQYKIHTEAFARNFINEGVIVKGDLPKDPTFWKNLKSEYLANTQHSEAEWERLTQAVPNEYKEMIQKKKAPQQSQLSPAMAQRLKNMGRM